MLNNLQGYNGTTTRLRQALSTHQRAECEKQLPELEESMLALSLCQKRLSILYTYSCNLADRFIGQQESQLTTVLLQPVVPNNPAKERRFIDRSWTRQEGIYIFFNVSTYLRTVCLHTSCLLFFATKLQESSVWWVRDNTWSWGKRTRIKLVALYVASHRGSCTIGLALKSGPSRLRTNPQSSLENSCWSIWRLYSYHSQGLVLSTSSFPKVISLCGLFFKINNQVFPHDLSALSDIYTMTFCFKYPIKSGIMHWQIKAT